jgi:hypothetical protein
LSAYLPQAPCPFLFPLLRPTACRGGLVPPLQLPDMTWTPACLRCVCGVCGVCGVGCWCVSFVLQDAVVLQGCYCVLQHVIHCVLQHAYCVLQHAIDGYCYTPACVLQHAIYCVLQHAYCVLQHAIDGYCYTPTWTMYRSSCVCIAVAV